MAQHGRAGAASSKPTARSCATCTPVIAKSGGAAEFRAGLPALLYWPGLLAFLAISRSRRLALAVRALLVGEWAAAALIGGFFALFVWQSGGFFDRNRPGDYRPDAVPEKLVPPK